MASQRWPTVPELFIPAILYGLYIPTFVNCIRWLLFEDEAWKVRSYKQMMKLYIMATVLIYALETADICIYVQLSLARLRAEQPTIDRLSSISIGIEATTLIIIDAVLIYRCWVVYSKSWRVICLPVVLWACTVICLFTWTISNTLSLELIDIPIAVPIIAAVFFACNFATNVYVTSAIVYQIRKTVVMVNSTHPHLYQLCCTVSGTGILYSFTSFLTLLASFWAFRNRLPLILINSINVTTACIAFNFVIIRVGQLRAGPPTTTTNFSVYHSSFL